MNNLQKTKPNNKVEEMKVLSLFDGISCARVALERAGFKVKKYYTSEVDKYAIQIAQKNYPDTIQLGDVRGITKEMVGDVDLIIGGFPCQDLSVAKNNREGLKGERSGLFYECVRLVNELKPKHFIFENVNSMPKEAKETITKELFGIEPIMIDANLVSAQNRKRLFWCGSLVGSGYYVKNGWVKLPEDKGIILADIIHELRGEPVGEKYFVSEDTKVKPRTIRNTRGVNEKANSMTATMYKGSQSNGTTCIRVGTIGNDGQGNRVYSVYGKSCTLSANGGGRGAKIGLYVVPVALRNRGEGKKPEYNKTERANALTTVQTDSMVQVEDRIRRLTPIECERLQCLDVNWTEGISDTQRYKCLGNAFNVDVVAHILKTLTN